MPLQLVDRNETYELQMPIKGDPEAEWPVFIMRKLSAGQVNQIQDKLVVSKPGDDESFGYLTGTANRLKIDLAVKEWRNVFNSKGEPVKCTDQTKMDLPSDAQTFIIEHIDEVNGLVNSKSRIKHEKN